MPNNKIIYYFLCARVTFYAPHFHFPTSIPSVKMADRLIFVKIRAKKDVPHYEAHPFGILFTLSFTPHNEALKHSPASHRELEYS